MADIRRNDDEPGEQHDPVQVEKKTTKKDIDLDEPKDSFREIQLKLPETGNLDVVQIELLATINKQLSELIKLNDRIAKALEAK